MDSERGFTLLELLVAFVIAALALGALFQGANGGLRSVSVANRYQEALSRARSRLATVGHGLALAPLHQSGDDGSGFHFQVDISLIGSAFPLRQPADAALGPAPRMALYSVAVDESWGSDGGGGASSGAGLRRVRLLTERAGLAP
jgi:general secretion pathway protein I